MIATLAELKRWETGADKLSVEFILDLFEQELKARGVQVGSRPEPREFALSIVNAFVHFPK